MNAYPSKDLTNKMIDAINDPSTDYETHKSLTNVLLNAMFADPVELERERRRLMLKNFGAHSHDQLYELYQMEVEQPRKRMRFTPELTEEDKCYMTHKDGDECWYCRPEDEPLTEEQAKKRHQDRLALVKYNIEQWIWDKCECDWSANEECPACHWKDHCYDCFHGDCETAMGCERK